MAERIAERNIGRLLVVGDAEQTRQFALEVAQCPQTGARGVDVIERAAEQIVQRGLWMTGFHRSLQKLATIGRQQGGGVAFAQTLAPLADGNLAQNMQFAAPRLLEADLAAEKQVELAGKRAFRAERPLGHGFHQPVALGEPVHDQAGIRQPGEADEDGRRALHAENFGKFWKIGDGNPAGEIR